MIAQYYFVCLTEYEIAMEKKLSLVFCVCVCMRYYLAMKKGMNYCERATVAMALANKK